MASTEKLIVVGASAGGIEALGVLCENLPPSLPAAMAVVLHIPPDQPSMLPTILSRKTSWRVTAAEDGTRLEANSIYVAPPDFHLLVTESALRVVPGPRENHHRPAIDALFRSAARAYRQDAIGMLLSGAGDDGVAGLIQMKAAGGMVLVQDPKEASFPSMPLSALTYVDVDHCLPVAELGGLLARLAGPAGREEMSVEPEVPLPKLDGTASQFTCPDCHGTLWERPTGGLLAYECRTGHVFSAGGMAEAQQEAVEEALWVAIRVLEESAAFDRKLAAFSRARGQSSVLAERYAEKARSKQEQSDLIRRIVAPGQPGDRPVQ